MLEQWCVEQANSYLESIIKRLEWLVKKTLLGKNREDIKEGYFCFPEGMHLVFYVIKDTQLEIIGVPHQSMDIVEYLV